MPPASRSEELPYGHVQPSPRGRTARSPLGCSTTVEPTTRAPTITKPPTPSVVSMTPLHDRPRSLLHAVSGTEFPRLAGNLRTVDFCESLDPEFVLVSCRHKGYGVRICGLQRSAQRVGLASGIRSLSRPQPEGRKQGEGKERLFSRLVCLLPSGWASVAAIKEGSERDRERAGAAAQLREGWDLEGAMRDRPRKTPSSPPSCSMLIAASCDRGCEAAHSRMRSAGARDRERAGVRQPECGKDARRKVQ